MPTKISIVLVDGILIALVIGARTGYFVRANEQSTVMADLDKGKEIDARTGNKSAATLKLAILRVLTTCVTSVAIGSNLV